MLVHPRETGAVQEGVGAAPEPLVALDGRGRFGEFLPAPRRRTAEAVVGRDFRLADGEVRHVGELARVESRAAVRLRDEILLPEVGMLEVRHEKAVDDELEVGARGAQLRGEAAVEARHDVAAPVEPRLPPHGVFAEPFGVCLAAQRGGAVDGCREGNAPFAAEGLDGVVVVAGALVAEPAQAVPGEVQGHALEGGVVAPFLDEEIDGAFDFALDVGMGDVEVRRRPVPAAGVGLAVVPDADGGLVQGAVLHRLARDGARRHADVVLVDRGHEAQSLAVEFLVPGGAVSRRVDARHVVFADHAAVP